MYEPKPIKAEFFEIAMSFSGHSNSPFAYKTFNTIEAMVKYAKSLKRNVYVRYEDWSNGPTSIYQEMFI